MRAGIGHEERSGLHAKSVRDNSGRDQAWMTAGRGLKVMTIGYVALACLLLMLCGCGGPSVGDYGQGGHGVNVDAEVNYNTIEPGGQGTMQPSSYSTPPLSDFCSAPPITCQVRLAPIGSPCSCLNYLNGLFYNGQIMRF